MHVVRLDGETDLQGWRRAARDLRLAGVEPCDVAWSTDQADLFSVQEPPSAFVATEPQFSVPRDFLELAEAAICHRSPDRFDILYRLLWRMRETPELMALSTDDDVLRLNRMAKEVNRACHKMKAFVRFRQVANDPETYVAWFEPPHRVLERTAGFFVNRFANVVFSILTPDACAHWDGKALVFTPGVDRGQAPEGDALEVYWRTYYASIFNPARLKVGAMTAEMPKRYWRNLPEASLIPELIEQAEARRDEMVRAVPAEPKKRTAAVLAQTSPPPVAGDVIPSSLDDMATLIQGCRRCDLWRHATQGVPGEGPSSAQLMLVGEQPGDMEDLAGKPFVGPAGLVLDRALAQAQIPRSEIFVTNAVRHFKHELRGKRRMHKTPDAGEVDACRWWLDHERRLVRPRMILAMGGTAVLGVFGKAMPIGKSRGQVFQLPDQIQAMVTVHPSYVLRIPDAAAKAEAFEGLAADLAAAWRLVA